MIIKTLMLILLVVSSALAVETNTFTFTNKAGTVFKDARLIKVENGEAVIIAGTVGARVKFEELPLEVQMIISQQETEEAARWRGIETKWRGDERQDSVFMEGTNALGFTRVMFQRRTKNGASSFSVALKVWMEKYRAFEKEFALDSGDGHAVEMAHHEEPKTVINPARYEGYDWDTFFSSTSSRDQMAALAGSKRLRLVIHGIDGSRWEWWLDMPDGAGRFAGVCASSKVAKASSVDAMETASIPTTKVVDVLSATMRVTESNSTWWKYAYKVDLRNNRAEAAIVTVKVKFLDRDGFVVKDNTNYKVVVPAGQKISLSDYALIDTKVAGNVRRMTAEWEWY